MQKPTPSQLKFEIKNRMQKNYINYNQTMQSFSQTQQYSKIVQHFASIKQPSVSLISQERTLLETVINHQNFPQISQKLSAIQSYNGELLANADLSFVQLRMQEIEYQKQKRARYIGKLKKGIQKLENSLGMVEDYHQTAISKLKWVESESQKFEQEREQIQQEIQIVSSQSNNKPEIKKDKQKGSKELTQILKAYECPNGFPRNKTEVLMLINRIQARIQHLQMNKLKDYEASP